MENNGFLGEERYFYPLKFLGITNKFTAIDVDTIINTEITLLVIIITVLIARHFILKKDTVYAFLARKLVSNVYSLIEQTFGNFESRHYYFISSLFLFILCCNWISLFPYLEEPTKNINTTLALGIVSFIYMHSQIIKSHGIKNYLKEFFMPLNIIFPFNLIAGLIMLPLKLLGEFASVISVSFRLFGNIFGGFVIASIWRNFISGSLILNLINLFTAFSLVISGFFIIFEGFLQAFVFSILTLTNIAMAINKEE